MTISISVAVLLVAAALALGYLLGRSSAKEPAAESELAQAQKEAEGSQAAPDTRHVSSAPHALDRGGFNAAVSAAIATYLGEDIKGLRILSVKPLAQKTPNRELLVAAVSAALATAMGTEVSGLRIRSIKRIGAPANERGQMIAAISAAIATAMNTDVNALRIHRVTKLS